MTGVQTCALPISSSPHPIARSPVTLTLPPPCCVTAVATAAMAPVRALRRAPGVHRSPASPSSRPLVPPSPFLTWPRTPSPPMLAADGYSGRPRASHHHHPTRRRARVRTVPTARETAAPSTIPARSRAPPPLIWSPEPLRPAADVAGLGPPQSHCQWAPWVPVDWVDPVNC